MVSFHTAVDQRPLSPQHDLLSFHTRAERNLWELTICPHTHQNSLSETRHSSPTSELLDHRDEVVNDSPCPQTTCRARQHGVPERMRPRKPETVLHDDWNRANSKTLSLEKLSDEVLAVKATVGPHDKQQRAICEQSLIGF